MPTVNLTILCSLVLNLFDEEDPLLMSRGFLRTAIVFFAWQPELFHFEVHLFYFPSGSRSISGNTKLRRYYSLLLHSDPPGSFRKK